MKKIGGLEITNISADHSRVGEDVPLNFTVRVTEDGKPWTGEVAWFSRYRPSLQEVWEGRDEPLDWVGPFDVVRSDSEGLATVVFPGQAAAPGTYEIKAAAMAEGCTS